MEHLNYLIVVDATGERAVFDAAQVEAEASSRITIRLNSGQQVVVPRTVLDKSEDGTYRIPVTFEQVLSGTVSSQALDASRLEDARVIPIVAEEVTVGKREVESGRVRIRKTVHEEEQQINEPLLREEVNVERRTINQYIDAPVSVRYEGETMIVPIVEEVLVVEKRLLLREELHVTKRQVEERHAQTVALRREEVHVEHISTDHKGSEE